MTALILCAVTLQRLGELIHARRNTAALLAKGGVEHSPGHMPLMIAIHAAWLIGLWWLAWGRPISWAWLAAYLVVQSLRVWVLATLGRRWTIRIITIPGEALVARGPYKFIRHPNYVVVVLEVLILPMVWGLWLHALVFSALNAGILWWRITCEAKALEPLR